MAVTSLIGSPFVAPVAWPPHSRRLRTQPQKRCGTLASATAWLQTASGEELVGEAAGGPSVCVADAPTESDPEALASQAAELESLLHSLNQNELGLVR